MTKISVITATFNAEKTVAFTLDSLFSQSHPFVESIVVDGCSSDSTREKIAPYLPKISVFVSEKDNGIYDALNKGIALSTGEVIGFLHSDDTFEDSEVLSEIAILFEDPEVDAVYGDLVYVNSDNPTNTVRYWRAGEFTSSSLKKGWMPPHPTLYVRRAAYEEFGKFNIKYRIAADYDSVLRFFSSRSFKSLYLPRILVRMRVGGVSNRSLKTILLKSREDMDIIRSNGIGGLATLALKNLRKIFQFRVQ